MWFATKLLGLTILLICAVGIENATLTHSQSSLPVDVDNVWFDLGNNEQIFLNSQCKQLFPDKNLTVCTVEKSFHNSEYREKQKQDEFWYRFETKHSSPKYHQVKFISEDDFLFAFGEVWGVSNINSSPDFKVFLTKPNYNFALDLPTDARRGYLVENSKLPQGIIGVIHQNCSSCPPSTDNYWTLFDLQDYSYPWKIYKGPVRFDISGIESSDEVKYVEPLLLSDPKKMYYLRQVTSRKSTIFRVDPNGRAVKLIEGVLTISDHYGFLTVCSKDQKVTCRQYDSEGKVKLTVDLEKVFSPISTDGLNLWLKVFNRPSGQIIVIGGYEDYNSEDRQLNVRITKIKAVHTDPTGKITGIIEDIFLSKNNKTNSTYIKCANSDLPDFSTVKATVNIFFQYCFNFMCGNRQTLFPVKSEIVRLSACHSSFEFH